MHKQTRGIVFNVRCKFWTTDKSADKKYFLRLSSLDFGFRITAGAGSNEKSQQLFFSERTHEHGGRNLRRPGVFLQKKISASHISLRNFNFACRAFKKFFGSSHAARCSDCDLGNFFDNNFCGKNF